MTFDTAEKILRASEDLFEEHTQLEVDLADVTASDSAGLALLLEWGDVGESQCPGNSLYEYSRKNLRDCQDHRSRAAAGSR